MPDAILKALMTAREAACMKQNDLIKDIKADSKDPETTGELLNQLTDAVISYVELCNAVSSHIVITPRKTPSWKKPFRK